MVSEASQSGQVFSKDSFEALTGPEIREFIDNYDRIAGDLSRPTQEMRTLKTLVDLVSEILFCKDQLVLDLGCGKGYVSSGIRFQKVICLDVSSAALKAIDGSRPKVQAFAERLPFHSRSFDIVIATDVFEHVLDLRATIEEIERVLVDFGLLVVAFPWKQDLSVYKHPSYKKQYKYVHLRSIDETVLSDLFANFIPVGHTIITNQMPGQFKPYEIMFSLWRLS